MFGQDLVEVTPSATMATTVATGKRRSRMQGMPPIQPGSVVMRSYVTTPRLPAGISAGVSEIALER